jgi:hypothetical protein
MGGRDIDVGFEISSEDIRLLDQLSDTEKFRQHEDAE